MYLYFFVRVHTKDSPLSLLKYGYHNRDVLTCEQLSNIPDENLQVEVTRINTEYLMGYK